MRHTWATELLRAGMPIEKVQRILGHSGVQQTLAYAELLEGDIIADAEHAEHKLSPPSAGPGRGTMSGLQRRVLDEGEGISADQERTDR